MKHRSEQGMAAIIVVCCLVGAAVVAGTLWKSQAWPGSNNPPVGEGPGSPEDYGKRLIERTTEYLGPDVRDGSMRYAGNRLACASCHINSGREPGSLSLMTAVERYPRQSPRSGTKETIEERINGCMTRSMAGRALPTNSAEMKAMVAYLNRLDAENAATGESRRKAHDPKDLKMPARKAGLKAGERVFAKRCAACHQDDGQGLPASADPRDGFVLPPLWGPNSFNDGAGMHRVITAARFIKAKMPLGSANLTDDEAFDVAAFINSKPRPEMAHLDQDYPDKTKKPVDAGFGPFADPFPLEQHRFGPFAPIEAFYKKPKPAK